MPSGLDRPTGELPCRSLAPRIVVYLAAIACAWSPYSASATEGRPLAGHGHGNFSRYVPSFDGTRIAVDVFLPSGGKTARWPALLLQTRTALFQRQAGLSRSRVAEAPPPEIEPYLRGGFAVVLQDRRGEGASFGVQKGFVTRDDARDAAEVIEWAAAQSWSNGRLGALGCSNQGAFQLPLAAEHPRHLVAIAPECASPFFFDTMISPNGVSAFAMGTAPPYDGKCAETDPPIGVPVGADRAPGFELAHAAAREHRCNARFLGQYWANMHRDSLLVAVGYRPGMEDTVMHRFERVRSSGVQVLQVGGWFDASPSGQLQAWQLVGGHVLIGPWLHCGTDSPDGGFRDAAFDRTALMLRWFDYTLKGTDNGFSREPPVRFYTLHARDGREWTSAPAWPLPGAARVSYYFQAGRAGSSASINDGGLLPVVPAAAARDTIHPDLSLKLFDGAYNELGRFWKGDMAQADARGLTYTLAVLDRDLQVTGQPVADLWAVSNSPDQDFFAVLEDVDADGRSSYVTHGAARASRRRVETAPWGDLGTPWHPQREGQDEALSDGVAAELRFDMIATSWVFRAGHRVRVSVFNAAGPRFQAPPDLRTDAGAEVALLTGADRASRMEMPIVPADSPYFAGSLPATDK